jgi:bifunctional enzyme CysN/CysC
MRRVRGCPHRRAGTVDSRCDLVGKTGHVNLMHHRPAVLWLTGLPGSGKSTIANLVEVALHVRGAHTIILDCDSVRMV